MKTNQPKSFIMWQHWEDPITKMSNQIKGKMRSDNIDAANQIANNESEYIDPDNIGMDNVGMYGNSMGSVPMAHFQPMMATPMGLVPSPMPDFTTFNFWIGHTNFIITNTIGELINRTRGVETLDIFTPYRFRIAVGKAFNENHVRKNVQLTLIQHIVANEQTQKHFSM